MKPRTRKPPLPSERNCSPERAAVDFCLPGTSTTHCDVNKPPMHTEFVQELNRYMDSKYMVFNPINKALQPPKWTSRMKTPDGQLANWRPALTAAHSIPPFSFLSILPFTPPFLHNLGRPPLEVGSQITVWCGVVQTPRFPHPLGSPSCRPSSSSSSLPPFH